MKIKQSVRLIITISGRSIISVSVLVIIGYIDWSFWKIDNIGIGIGYDPVISIVVFGRTIISVSVSVIIG